MKKIITSLALLLTLGYAKIASAAAVDVPVGDYDTGGASRIQTVITTLINYAIGIAALVSLVYIIVGGFNYITSAGNAEKVKTAQKTITYAIIGLAVVVLAYAIRAFVFDRLGLNAPPAAKI